MSKRRFTVDDVQIGAAGTLVAGADQIDRWNYEISRTIALIQGKVGFEDLLDQDQLIVGRDNVVVFEYDLGRWDLVPDGSRWQINYWVKTSPESVYTLIFTGAALPDGDVKKVRDGLDYLIAGLRKHSYDFDRRIMPHVFAAPKMGRE
jgi:hypothetical protein